MLHAGRLSGPCRWAMRAPDDAERVDSRKAAAAKRARLSRGRRARGEASGRIDYNEHDQAAALIASARLTEAQALRRDCVERELGAVLREWAARWLRSH